MLDLTLFRSGTYTGANVAMLLVALAMFGVFFFVSLYMQNVLGYSAVQAGAAFLPMTVLIILIAPIAGKASDRFGSRWLMTIGMVLLGVQLLYFSQLSTTSDFWNLLPGFILGGLGMAMAMTPTAAAATRAVPVHKSGVGSAVLNAMRQVGGSIGIALMGAIVADQASGRPGVEGFMAGFERALIVAAVIAFAGLDRRVRARTPGDDGAGSGAGGARCLSTTGQARLPAAERRQAIVDAALRVFAGSSYSGATTAEIARAAGISEPILYRHFASKRELYLACLEAAWASPRAAFDAKLDELGDHEAVTAIGEASREFHASGGIKPVTLWIQALTEAGEDEEIRGFLRRQLREVHDYVARGGPARAGGGRRPRRPRSRCRGVDLRRRGAPHLVRRPARRPARPGRLRAGWRPSAAAGSPARARTTRPTAGHAAPGGEADPLGVLGAVGICSRRSRSCLRP